MILKAEGSCYKPSAFNAETQITQIINCNIFLKYYVYDLLIRKDYSGRARLKQANVVAMLRNYWMERGVTLALLLVFFLLAYLSFGHPLYFDRLFLVVLVAVLTIVKVNKDLVSILLGLLLVRSLDEVAFFISDISQAKVLFYSLSFYILFKLRHDQLIRLFVGPIYLLSLTTELYWYSIGYGAPSIHTYVVLLSINSLFRHFLIVRKHYSLLRDVAGSANSIDYKLYRLAGVSNFLVGSLIIEYLIRHLTHFKPMFVYDAYSYIMQMVSLAVFYFVVDNALKSKFKMFA